MTSDNKMGWPNIRPAGQNPPARVFNKIGELDGF